jgi:hypothetical protein
MSKKSSKHRAAGKFPVGSRVRVKAGTTDPDFPDMPLGGWTGKVREANPDVKPPAYLIEWDRYTLHNVHPGYRSRCEREGLDLERMWLDEGSLEPDKGEPAAIEQPTAIASPSLDPSDQEDRIRAAFRLRTRDDPIPGVCWDSLRRYYRYLVAHLSFPFPASLASPIGPHQDTRSPLSVIRLLDVDRYCPEECSGLICKAKQKDGRIELPLDRIEVARGNPNRQLVDDYSFWFANWG